MDRIENLGEGFIETLNQTSFLDEYTPVPEDDRGTRLATNLKSIMLVVMLLSSIGLALFLWYIADANTASSNLGDRARSLDRSAGKLRFYCEIISQSVLMASVTGETSWIKRYHEFYPMVDGAMAQIFMTTEEMDGAYRIPPELVRDYRALSRMENEILALVQAGDIESARQVIAVPEYNNLVRRTAENRDRVIASLRHDISAKTESIDRQMTWLIVGSVSLMVILLGSWSTLAVMLRRHILIRETALTALRGDALRHGAMVQQRERLLEQIGTFVYRHDKHGIFEYLSPAVEKLTGYTMDEWKNHYSFLLTDNPINEKVAEHTEAALTSGQSGPSYHAEIFHKDGSRMMLDIVERPYFKDDEVAGIIGVARDITSAVRFQKTIQEREGRLNAIFDNAVDGIIVVNERGLIQSFNHAAESVFGYGAAEVIGQRVNMLMAQPHAEKHDKYISSYKTTGLAKVIGKTTRVEGIRKNGDRILINLSLSEVRSGDERTFIGILRDVTEQVQSEVNLRETMSELERFNLLAVDRELRMIELKKQLNEVLNWQGKPAQYNIPNNEMEVARSV